MPPRLPITAPARLCAAPLAMRPCVAALSTSARLCAPPRQPPPASSSASFLDLDGGSGNIGRSRAAASAAVAAAAAEAEAKPSSSSSPSLSRSSRADTNGALSQLLFDNEVRRKMFEKYEKTKQTALERMTERKVSDDFTRQMPRRWRVGDLYAPHDLSAAEAAKWRRPSRTTADVVDILGIDPLDEYRNFSMISEFMTPLGRIKHSSETGLRPVNQRRMARAIRRAVGLGIHPSVHRHPEILMSEITNLPRQSYAASQQENRSNKRFRI